MESVNNKTDLVTTEFQNGKIVITPEVSGYVSRYQGFIRKTAESIIGLAETLIEAEDNLNQLDFSIFCDEIGIRKGDSTYSKLKKIGDNVTRFSPFVDRLPNSWTTIYKLAKLNPDQFDLISASLTPYTTSKEIDFQINGDDGPKDKANPDLKIVLGLLSPEIKKEIYDKLNEMSKEYNFSVKANSAILSEMKTIVNKKAA